MPGGASVITRKGQVTIPAEVRRSLGLKEGDRVEFVVEGKTAKVVPVGNIIKRTAGIFNSDLPPLSAEELRKEAEKAIADDAVRRAGG